MFQRANPRALHLHDELRRWTEQHRPTLYLGILAYLDLSRTAQNQRVFGVLVRMRHCDSAPTPTERFKVVAMSAVSLEQLAENPRLEGAIEERCSLERSIHESNQNERRLYGVGLMVIAVEWDEVETVYSLKYHIVTADVAITIESGDREGVIKSLNTGNLL